MANFIELTITAGKLELINTRFIERVITNDQGEVYVYFSKDSAFGSSSAKVANTYKEIKTALSQ